MAALACDIKIRSVSYDGYTYKILCLVKNTGTAQWTTDKYHLRAHSIERDQGMVLDVILVDGCYILPNNVSSGQEVQMELHVPANANTSILGYRDQQLIVDMVYDADVILEGGQWFRNGVSVQLSPYQIPNVFVDSETKFLEANKTSQSVLFEFTVYQITIQVAEDCTSSKKIYINENGETATVNDIEMSGGDVYTITRKFDKDKGIQILANDDQAKVKIVARR